MATAERIWSRLMLSSRISAAPAARASPTWSSVSHSTSTTTPGWGGGRGGGPGAAQRGRHEGEARQSAWGASHDVRGGFGAGGYDGCGGDVGTVTQVPLEGGAPAPVRVAWVRCHAATPFDR